MNYIYKNLLSILIILPLFLMSGCNKKEETFRTVEYFNQHKDIREARVEECKSFKEVTETIAKDCENASTSVKNNAPVKKQVDTSGWFLK